MHEHGKIILNGDDSLLWNQKKSGNHKAIYFGVSKPDCDLKGLEIREADGMLYFLAQRDRSQFAVELALEGQHYVHDALAAIAVGMELGVGIDDIGRSLSQFQNMAGRQEIFEKNGFTIIRDCYTAGPESMAAALNVLGNRPGRHVAVLGDMLELGACTRAEHYKVGRIAAEKADILLAFGPNSDGMLNGARTGGMSANYARAFTDKEKMIQVLKQMAKPGDAILFKGSRGMRMEQVLEAFLQEEK